jgi:hypothetical protein
MPFYFVALGSFGFKFRVKDKKNSRLWMFSKNDSNGVKLSSILILTFNEYKDGGVGKPIQNESTLYFTNIFQFGRLLNHNKLSTEVWRA